MGDIPYCLRIYTGFELFYFSVELPAVPGSTYTLPLNNSLEMWLFPDSFTILLDKTRVVA
jgi:hypothetical protein